MTEEEKSIKDKKAISDTDTEAIKSIIKCYLQNEKVLVNQLFFKAKHGTTIGGFRENVWKSMFEQIIPKKFVIEQSVFIIDSNKQISKEVDLAIFDEMYTPYIFQYGEIKFIPIEAVAVVVECKSQNQDSKNLKQWAEKIETLETNLESYTRFATTITYPKGHFENSKHKHDPDTKQKKATNFKATQSRTRPLRIFCCLNNNNINSTLENNKHLFDIVIRAFDKPKLQVELDESYPTLQSWYLELNHYKHDKKNDDIIEQGDILKDVFIDKYKVNNVPLLSLNLQLNQLLMLINNPIPFPHIAYAEMFNDLTNGESLHE